MLCQEEDVFLVMLQEQTEVRGLPQGHGWVQFRYKPSRQTSALLGRSRPHTGTWNEFGRRDFSSPFLEKRATLEELSLVRGWSFCSRRAPGWSHLLTLPAWELTRGSICRPWSQAPHGNFLSWLLWASASFLEPGESLPSFLLILMVMFKRCILTNFPPYLWLMKTIWTLSMMFLEYASHSPVCQLSGWPLGACEEQSARTLKRSRPAFESLL